MAIENFGVEGSMLIQWAEIESKYKNTLEISLKKTTCLIN